MDRDAMEFWGGVALVSAGGLALFASLLLRPGVRDDVLLIASVLAMAVGTLLVAISRRGPAA